MLYFKKDMSFQRKLKYLFFYAFLLWILVSVYVFYQYLLQTSKQVVAKGGTFVEGIFETTSYLPYLRNDKQSKFYQSFLFDPCLSYEYIDGDLNYSDELCHITTKDFKTYYVSLMSGYTRSNGVPVSIDDIFFTYNDILAHNTRNIPYLDIYNDIKVSQTNDTRVKVEFPNESPDNTLFFTNYILPRHALVESTLNSYQKDFSIEPVYTRCSRIVPQSTDPYSLVFDMSACEDTNLGYYQIKNTTSYEQFQQSVDLNGSIVDAYEYTKQASGYVKIDLQTNKFVTLFFNTKSKKASVRLRRSLGGFIMHNFFKDNDSPYIQKYKNNLFSTFLSTGGNIGSFLSRVDVNSTLSKEDLVDVGIPSLPSNIVLSGTNLKKVYYVESIKNFKTIDLKFDTAYDKIIIYYSKDVGTTLKSYSKKNKTAQYDIGPQNNNLKPGINKYIIYGYDGDDKTTIATIDIYDLKGDISSDMLPTNQTDEKLIVLYHREPTSMAVADQLQKILAHNGLLEHFIFQGVENPEEMEGKLTMGDYDIVINSFDMGLKKDISKLFTTSNPQINHSQYNNDRFVSLLQQYLKAKDKAFLEKQINDIYKTDMPFVILGTAYSPLYIKADILDKLTGSVADLHELTWRNTLYHNLRLVENVSIDVNQIGNLKQFGSFVKTVLKRDKVQDDNTNELGQEITVETGSVATGTTKESEESKEIVTTE